MKVCFIGHRNIENEEKIKKRLYEVVSTLIIQGADTFLFGSRSDFDNLSWGVVTELQRQYPNIKRVKYNAPHETAFESKEERERYERIYSELVHKEAHFSDYEEVVECEKATVANKNAYVMRNQEMIKDSDVCIFYYDKNYLPPKRKQSDKRLSTYQPKSGTAIAYQYACSRKKTIINTYK